MYYKCIIRGCCFFSHHFTVTQCTDNVRVCVFVCTRCLSDYANERMWYTSLKFAASCCMLHICVLCSRWICFAFQFIIQHTYCMHFFLISFATNRFLLFAVTPTTPTTATRMPLQFVCTTWTSITECAEWDSHSTLTLGPMRIIILSDETKMMTCKQWQEKITVFCLMHMQ